MNRFSINVLGPRFVRDGSTMALVRAKAIALLLYLAVTRMPQTCERVIDPLWPESLPQAARKNMHNTLWAIGEALGDGVLEQDGAVWYLAPGVAVDVHVLEMPCYCCGSAKPGL
ncbi:MAG: hypothetical protein SH847_17190 [Roseiflexaceae bacterium]|nr:hypothetical protein [Roseiflexaceae bacterium]